MTRCVFDEVPHDSLQRRRVAENSNTFDRGVVDVDTVAHDRHPHDVVEIYLTVVQMLLVGGSKGRGPARFEGVSCGPYTWRNGASPRVVTRKPDRVSG